MGDNIYEDELERLDKERPSGGGGGSRGGWLNIDKPAKEGERRTTEIRILPRLRRLPDGSYDQANPYYVKFWVDRREHKIRKGDALEDTLVCPDTGVEGAPVTCPICILQRELYATRDAGHEKVAKGLYPSTRFFCNVIDYVNIADHFNEDGTGKTKVYGYGRTVQKGLLQVCTKKGPIDDVQIGRRIGIVCFKKGKRQMDVEYHVTEASDAQPLPEEHLPIFWASQDLEGLTKPTDMEELRKKAQELDPRGRGASRPAPAAAPGPAAGGYSYGTNAQPAQWGAPPSRAGGHGAPPVGGGYPAPGGPVAAGGYSPSAGPGVGAPPVPAPRPPAPAQAPVVRFHHTGPMGQSPEPLGPAQVADLIRSYGGDHFVWREGWADWAPALQVPEIAGLLGAGLLAPQVAPPPVRAPGYTPGGGYPAPGGVQSPAPTPQQPPEVASPPQGNAAPGGPPLPPGPPGGPAF